MSDLVLRTVSFLFFQPSKMLSSFIWLFSQKTGSTLHSYFFYPNVNNVTFRSMVPCPWYFSTYLALRIDIFFLIISQSWFASFSRSHTLRALRDIGSHLHEIKAIVNREFSYHYPMSIASLQWLRIRFCSPWISRKTFSPAAIHVPYSMKTYPRTATSRSRRRLWD